ncbi:hypothetical protein TrVGV298_000298 [Trichoderma virens]|nr:hypothetical protein TrVGV298_000298 [Trichoderma virens]
MDISSALEIGSTGRSNDWILERAHFLVHNWGTYRPILWNCQHFAVFIAQITVATEESASIISRIMSSRREFVFNKRIQRHVGCMVGLGASTFVPVVGPALALGFWATARIRMATDYVKDTQIASQWKTFVGKCEELHQIWFR